MRILIVVSTEAEIKPLIGLLQPKGDGYILNNNSIKILITGVGMAATIYQLTKKIGSKKFDFVLNIGIAGCLDRAISLGEVVNVVSDEFYELGVEDDEEFISMFSIGLIDKDNTPFTDGKLINPSSSKFGLKQLHGLTVNTVHGNETTIKAISGRSNATIESMEGAAFMYVCLLEKIPFLQIRATSNYVEKRNRLAWNISLAIKNLNNKAFEILNEL
jgi:futalosine hydrolase